MYVQALKKAQNFMLIQSRDQELNSDDVGKPYMSIKVVWLLILMVYFLVLTGCGAVHTLVKKRDLDVQTKMSDTIFIEPVSPENRIIYISVRNTSDKQLDIKSEIISRIKQSGYTITEDPEKANFMLQANVLQAGKTDLRAINTAYDSGFGGGLLGAGAVAGSGGDSRQVIVGGIVGATAGFVGDALVEDTLYSMITDIQVRERPLSGEYIVQKQDTNVRQGSSTSLKQNVSGAQVNWKIYRARIASTANKANLEFEEARQPLQEGLFRSISGIFAN